MKSKICTSIEQSQKLKELGIDRKSSDMYYWCGSDLRIGGYKAQDEDLDIPAWSLSALLKMLPLPTLEETMITTTETKWKCTIYDKSHAKYWSELHNDAIDAAFEMVCWLKENKKI